MWVYDVFVSSSDAVFTSVDERSVMQSHEDIRSVCLEEDFGSAWVSVYAIPVVMIFRTQLKTWRVAGLICSFRNLLPSLAPPSLPPHPMTTWKQQRQSPLLHRFRFSLEKTIIITPFIEIALVRWARVSLSGNLVSRSCVRTLAWYIHSTNTPRSNSTATF